MQCRPVGLPITDLTELRLQRRQLRAAIAEQLAADVVQRLDAIGALVELGDAAVAHQLLHAPLADIAVAAVDLHAEAGDFLAHIGEERLDDGDQQRRALARRLAISRLGMAVFEVQLPGAIGGQHAAPLDQGFLRQQHAPHVRMHDDRVSHFVRVLRASQSARLQTLTRIGQRALIGLFGNAKSLQTDLEPRVVHHGEHACQALVGLANDPTGGVIEVHHAGSGALDAHLVLDGTAGQRVTLARRTVSAGDELGHQQQADAFNAGRCIR